mmetsp:Transcript_11830/g.37661  ORF Transcript_11830/g.37661 Transcript_11830/m.37661 type:complete len:293 (-) Transcript_11830:38-916(-)
MVRQEAAGGAARAGAAVVGTERDGRGRDERAGRSAARGGARHLRRPGVCDREDKVPQTVRHQGPHICGDRANRDLVEASDAAADGPVAAERGRGDGADGRRDARAALRQRVSALRRDARAARRRRRRGRLIGRVSRRGTREISRLQVLLLGRDVLRPSRLRQGEGAVQTRRDTRRSRRHGGGRLGTTDAAPLRPRRRRTGRRRALQARQAPPRRRLGRRPAPRVDRLDQTRGHSAQSQAPPCQALCLRRRPRGARLPARRPPRQGPPGHGGSRPLRLVPPPPPGRGGVKRSE